MFFVRVVRAVLLPRTICTICTIFRNPHTFSIVMQNNHPAPTETANTLACPRPAVVAGESSPARNPIPPTSSGMSPTPHIPKVPPSASAAHPPNNHITRKPMNTSRYQAMQKRLLRLKQQCPMPVLLRKLRLGAYAKPSSCSPFRIDENASWGIFETTTGWRFKDHATEESGDEITLIARWKGWDTRKDFGRIVDFYHVAAARQDQAGTIIPPSLATPVARPDLTGFTPGTDEQLEHLSRLRTISVAALQEARQRGFLIFGRFQNFEVFGVKDQSGKLGEVRRLDGEWFPAFGHWPEHKSHTLRGSTKNWPLGLIESASAAQIALVEGLPDFLAAFDFVLREHKTDVVAPVALLSTSVNLDSGIWSQFAGKRVRLYPHSDRAGIEAASRWGAQLGHIDAVVDFFNFARVGGGKDLADLNKYIATPPASLTLTLTEEVLP